MANLRTPHSLDPGNSTYPESTACVSDSYNPWHGDGCNEHSASYFWFARPFCLHGLIGFQCWERGRPDETARGSERGSDLLKITQLVHAGPGLDVCSVEC